MTTRTDTRGSAPKSMRLRAWLAVAGLCMLGLLAGGCSENMREQPRFKYLEQSDFFPDGKAARTPPAGTVARGQLGLTDAYHTGVDSAGNLVGDFPRDVSPALLERGRQVFNTYCAVCHGEDGYGDGIVVRRGFPEPPTFHSQRLRGAPIGYFVYVINNGYGVMYSYKAKVKPDDRWAVAAYIRALQLSQAAPAEALGAEDRAQLEEVQP